MSLLPSRTALVPLLLALGCLVGTGWAALQSKRDVEADAAREFAFAADQLTLAVHERLVAHSLILHGAAGLFRSVGRVDRAAFRDYVAELEADTIVPGLQGVGYAQVIPRAWLARHEAAVRAEGFPDYRVRPEGRREVYTSIVFLEPFRDRNLRAFGFDMFSEPVRRAAMERARDSGHPALSGKVVLVQETDEDVQSGTLMYLPVYDPSLPVDTVAQRRTALRGWVYSPFRMRDLLRGVVAEWESALGRYVALSIYAGDRVESGQLLYGEHLPVGRGQALLREQRRIDFDGDQPWLLDFHRRADAPGLDYGPVWLILAGGLLASLLLPGLAGSLLATRERARRIADTLTHDIRERERQLAESEFRWHFAIEGAGDGLWDWNIPAGKVFYSSRLKSMLGYAEFEMGDGIDEWESRLHPEDRAATLAIVQGYLSGQGGDAYVSEHRLRCKDGSYLWVLDRGIAVARDAIGQPTRMIGTHTDIHARKTMEESLRRSEADLKEAQRIARMGSWKLQFPSGRLEWSEAIHRMFGFAPAEPTPPFAELAPLFVADSWQRLSAAVEAAREGGTPYELELELQPRNGRRVWMQARGEATRDAAGAVVGLHGSATDISERVEARIRIEHLGKLYAALSACNWAIIRCPDQTALFDRLCEVVVRQGGMRMAWIGLVNEDDGRISPLHAFGEGTDYLDGIEVSIRADDPHGLGPTGTASRENRPVWVDYFQSDPLTAPWKERGRRYGWAASAAIPICRGGRPVGALTIYSTESGWFDADTRGLLEEIGSNISFALDKLDAEAEAAQYQTGLVEAEQRFRSLVEQSIAGAFILQDGRVVYANPRMAGILGYASPAELSGRALLELVVERDRATLAALFAQLDRGEHSEGTLLFSAQRRDGEVIEVGINSSLSSYRGKPAVIGLMQDISDREMAEAQIRRYAKQLEHTFMQTVGLANTLSEMRDPYTAGHERRVADIAVAIGREMGFDEKRLEGLRVGGYLHDVGKMVIPAEILAKPARLSAVEYELIKSHPQAGYDILKEVDFPWPVAEIALQHHERYDGSGYPRGLKGEAIAIEARIVAVADVVESMASHRPYRPGLGLDKALAEIEAGIGTRYDPVPARCCLRLFREQGFTLNG